MKKFFLFLYKKQDLTKRNKMNLLFLKNLIGVEQYIENKEQLCIVHDYYKKRVTHKENVVLFSDFKLNYLEYKQYQHYVLIGINKIMNPANRTDLINTYLIGLTPEIKKTIIDETPFIGEAWRVFYPFLYAKKNYLFNHAYSYPIEAEYIKVYYRDSEDDFFQDEQFLKTRFSNHFYSNLEKLNSSFSFVLKDDDLEFYKEAKEILKELNYSTPKLIINNLLKMCNKHFQLNFDCESYLENKVFTLPDLKIYRFIAQENIRRMNVYNVFTREDS